MITTITLNAALDKTYWISSFEKGKVNRIDKQLIEAGGKGVNVAKVLSSLGDNPITTGFIGGFNGELLRRDLQKFNVNQDWITVEGETRTCLNIIDEHLNQETELLEQGLSIKEDDWQRFLIHMRKLTDKSDLILISGSLPRGLHDEAYSELMNEVIESGKKVGIDTNGITLKKCIEHTIPTFIKPNISELEEYCGKPLTTIEETVEEAINLYERGIKYVMVSLGKDGAICVSKSGIYKADIPSVQTVNTVGSGDATFAGFGLILNQSDDAQLALKSGMAAGIANSLMETAGRVKKEDYLYYLNQIKINKLAEVKI
jgi:tagatose 6-phosphate kinase